MFGESRLFGKTEISIDNKGRIRMPIDTKREEGDQLLLLSNSDLDVYEIYSENKIVEKFEELNKLIMSSKNKKDKLFYEKNLLKLSSSILRSQAVDKQGRLLTGKIFEGYEKVLSIGAHDHLIIQPIKNKK